MTEKRAEVFFIDPITGRKIKVRSVCYPSRTLLQGMDFSHNNRYLGQMQRSILEAR